jgi:hypothetical protein
MLALGMHPEDLKTIWVCRECGRNFIFNSDVEDHKKQFNHSCMTQFDFKKGKKVPVKFTSGKASLGFKVDGKFAKVIIEYRYYASDDSISYVDVIYTNPKLQSLIEGNIHMMRNIDNYIRKIERSPSKKSQNQNCT